MVGSGSTVPSSPGTGTGLGTDQTFTLRTITSLLPRALPEGSQYVRGTGLVAGEVEYQETVLFSAQVEFEDVPTAVELFRLEFIVNNQIFGVYEESIDNDSLQDGIYTITDPFWEDIDLLVEPLDNLALARIRDMDVIDANTLWLCGDDGTLLKSVDGGGSFIFFDAGTELDIRGISFFDHQNGRFVAGNNEVFSTTDGGESWTSLVLIEDNPGSLVQHSFRTIFFSSATGGVLGGTFLPTESRGTIYQTQNAGSSWTETFFRDLRNTEITDFAGTSPTLYACGLAGLLLKSENDGSTWISSNTGLPSSRLRDVDFEVDNMRGYTLTSNQLYVTQNGAASWTGSESGTRLRAVAAVDSQIAVAVGGPTTDGSQILRTVDGGLSWSPVGGERPDVQLNEVEFANTSVGYAVSTDGVVLRSEDGGASWSVSFDPRVELESELFDAALVGSTGFIVGADDLFLKSNDGGQSFEPATVGADAELFALAFINQNLGFVAGEEGQIWRTFDSGSDWELVSTGLPYDYSAIRDLSAPSSSHIFAVGDNSDETTIVRSLNGGRSWELTNSNLASVFLRGVSFADDMNGVVVGEGGFLATTVDAAENWQIRSTGISSDLNSVFFHSNGSLSVAVGDNGNILRSTDGGQNWESQPSGTTKNLLSVAFSTELSGICVGFDGIVLQTLDGGLTWENMNLGIPYNLNAVTLSLGQGGLMVGEHGAIAVVQGGLEGPSFVESDEPTPTGLELLNEPSNAEILAILDPPSLMLQSSNLSGLPITASLQRLDADTEASLLGTTTRSTFGGKATFDDLAISEIGTYQLIFEAQGLPPITSLPFDVTDNNFGRFVCCNGNTSGVRLFVYNDMASADGSDPPDQAISSGFFQRPFDVAASARRNILFVADPNNNCVDLFALDADGIVDRTDVIENTSNPLDLQYDDENDRLFVLERSAGRIRVRDGASNAGSGDQASNRFITGFDRPEACRYAPEDDRLFVFDSGENSIYAIDNASIVAGDLTTLNPSVITNLSSRTVDFDYDQKTDNFYLTFDDSPDLEIISVIENTPGPAVISRVIELDNVQLGRRQIVLDEVREIAYLLNTLNNAVEAYPDYRTITGSVSPERTINVRAQDAVLVRKEY